MDRRRFLRIAGAGAVVVPIAACAGSGSSTGTPVTSMPVTGSPPVTPSPSLTPPDWTALGRRLKGPLVRPGDSRYPASLQLLDPRFDGVRPAGIAYVASTADVATCLAFARSTGVGLAVRAGGGSYAGYSTGTGLIVDVTSMNGVAPQSGGTATIGAGARLVDVYAGLAAAGVSIPAGSCPTVGLAGLAMGGGIGVVGRRYGLTCDRITGAQVVLASGDVVQVDATRDADLFWALRGGGGGTMGVVTSFTFATHPTTPLALFTYSWDWSHAHAVLGAWQRWTAVAPDALWSNCLLLSRPSAGTSGTPQVKVNGVYVGTSSQLSPLVAALTDAVGAAPNGSYLGERDYLSTMLYEGGCAGEPVAACHLPSVQPGGRLSRVAQVSASDFFTGPLPSAGIDAVVNGVAGRQRIAGLGEGGVGFDAYGGAINRVPAGETAFVHRDALMCAQYTAGLAITDPVASRTANQVWLASFHASMRPYASGYAYQNYIDASLADWKHAYYGTNYARLVRTKAAYDPSNLFHSAQSIPVA